MKAQGWSRMIPIYEVMVHLAIGESIEEAKQILPKRFHDIDTSACSAIFLCAGEGHFAFLFTQNKLTSGRISHEIRHCTDEILTYLGAEDHEYHGELVAHLQGWIGKWVGACIERSGLKISGH